MINITFNRANLTVKETAQALGLDVQTVRVLLQTGAVSWGQAIRKPGSTHFLYLISPRRFYEETGVLLGAQMPDEYEIWERQQTSHSDDADFVRYCQKQMDEADARQDAERRKRRDDIR